MTLASDLKRQLIKEACRSNRWQISGKATRWLGTIGISHETVIKAVIQHIDDGCLIHVKILHASVSYHGSVLLDPDDAETVYFEVKILDDRVEQSEIWLQVHSHDSGYPILPRR